MSNLLGATTNSKRSHLLALHTDSSLTGDGEEIRAKKTRFTQDVSFDGSLNNVTAAQFASLISSPSSLQSAYDNSNPTAEIICNDTNGPVGINASPSYSQCLNIRTSAGASITSLYGNTAPSNDPTSGAITTVGGLGVGANIFAGGKLDTVGIVNVQDTTTSTSSSTGSIITAGGIGVANGLFVGGGDVSIDPTKTLSVPESYGFNVKGTITGYGSLAKYHSALINPTNVNMGAAANQYYGLTIKNPVTHSGSNTNEAANLMIEDAPTIGGTEKYAILVKSGVCKFADTTTSTSSSTGSIITAGGIGVAKGIHCDGDIDAGYIVAATGKNIRSNEFRSKAVTSDLTIGDNLTTGDILLGNLSNSHVKVRGTALLSIELNSYKYLAKGFVAGVYLINGAPQDYFPFPIYYSCPDMADILTQPTDSGDVSVGQVSTATGTYLALDMSISQDAVLVLPGYGIQGKNAAGTVILDFKNTTNNPVSVRATGGFNTMKSCTIWFNDTEQLKN